MASRSSRRTNIDGRSRMLSSCLTSLDTATRLTAMPESPLQPQHQAVQPAADAQPTDAVARLQELALLRQRRRQRQRHRADVAQVLVGRELLLRRDAQRLQNRLAVPGPDLVADHL